MPNYSFQCRDCEAVQEKFLTMDKCMEDQACPECGGVARRVLGARVTPSGNWPMYSEAMGVHIDQIPEAVAESKRRGVPTEYDSIGRPKFESKSHRRRFCEAFGAWDKDAGYGDPVRR